MLYYKHKVHNDDDDDADDDDRNEAHTTQTVLCSGQLKTWGTICEE